MRARTMVMGSISVLVLLCATASADIVLRQQYPVEGQATTLIVQDEAGAPVTGATISVVYRPGSSVERGESIGSSGDGGLIDWTPATAGIATVTATWTNDDGEETSTATNVSVKFRRVPITGIIIMVFAGLLLVGGSAVRIRNLLVAG